MKKVLIFLTFLFLFPTIIFSDSSNSDITFSATFEAGFTYGNVSDCNTGTGIYYFKGINKVGDYDVCLWSAAEKRETSIFSCEDNSMEKFPITVNGSDGNEYYGYGCRKPNDESSIEYQEQTIYVGQDIAVGNMFSDSCEIISGHEYGHLGSDSPASNPCWLTADKEGVVKLKIKNKTDGWVRYLQVNIERAYVKVSELDNKYKYGSVKSCELYSEHANLVNFDNLKFCGYQYGKDGELIKNLTCQDTGYEPFFLNFESADGIFYKGYGCRKIVEETEIKYEDKTIYVGQDISVGNMFSDNCEIISGGEYGHLGSDSPASNPCWFTADKVGNTKIKVTNKNTSLTKYYNFTIKKAITSISELDDKYYYGSVKACSLLFSGKDYAKIVNFEHLKFCGNTYFSPLNPSVFECENDDYEQFALTFSDGTKVYEGFGCRKEKTDEDFEAKICKVVSYVKKVSNDKNISLEGLPPLLINGVEYNINDLSCNNDISCSGDECNYFLEKEIKNVREHCNTVYQNYSFNEYDSHVGRMNECISFNSFYVELVNKGIVNDLASYCGILSEGFASKVSFVLNIIMIAGPILAILLGTVDFIKVITNGDADKEMKTAFKHFMIRVGSAALLFIIPLLLSFILNIFMANEGGYDPENPFCNVNDWSEQ